MDADPIDEGAYDAPVDSYPSNTSPLDSNANGNQAAERQARLDKVRQRRAELAQNRSSVSSNLTQTSAPLPTVAKESALAPLSSSSTSIRSDIVREAVEFLTNPRVASAPVATKRRFLTERKGLTEAEADEAFRRAQSSPASAAPAAAQGLAPPTPPVPQYYGAPVVYQPQPPVQVGPSLKSVALIVVLGVGAATIIIQLFKKYIWAYWFPKKNALAEKIEFLESKLQSAHEHIAAQAAETKEAMVVLRSFLESQVTDWQERSRLDSLRSSQDLKAMSDLKREVSSVRHLIPSVSTLSRTAKSSTMQSDVLDEIKNELMSLKNAVKSIVSNVPSGANLLRLSTAPAATTPVEAAPVATETASSAPAATQASVTSSAPATTAAANPLNTSASKRGRPSWMNQSQKATTLPSWQMQDKAAEVSPSPSPEPAADAPPQPEASTPVVEPSASEASDEPPYSASYVEVVNMLRKGITPPGLKTDVDDTPTDPDAPLNYDSVSKPNKPWITTSSAAPSFDFKLEAVAEDADLPRNIGSLDHSSQGDSELELDDIELA